MSQLWRISVVTGVGLFLETCAFYMVFLLVSGALNLDEASLPFWLVFLTLIWAFLMSGWVQRLPFSSRLRGAVGLVASAVSLFLLSYLDQSLGNSPVDVFLDGGARTVTMLVFGLVFLLLLWWRGATMAYEEITLDSIRNSFRWGLMALFAVVLFDAFSSKTFVSGFLVVGFFAVGLVGLALARFSWEAGDAQVMSGNWLIPIVASAGAVIIAALLIGALGMGGLDEFTRTTLSSMGEAGRWVLLPVLLAMGGLASLLVTLANLVSGWFGGGDLSGLELAQQQLGEFRQQMQEKTGDGGLPPILLSLIKGTALAVALAAAAWFLYRIFRLRRLLQRSGSVEETRESLYSWSRANRDLSALLADWWNSLPGVGRKQKEQTSEPANPREFYHRLLNEAEKLGRPRWEWETPKQHQVALRGMLPREPVGRIVDWFQTSHYGQSDPEEAGLAELRRDWAAITEFIEEQGRRE